MLTEALVSHLRLGHEGPELEAAGIEEHSEDLGEKKIRNRGSLELADGICRTARPHD